MSGYQFYDFQAIDRPLGIADQEALKKLSPGARITSTRFTDHYNWGDLRRDPRKMVERRFDLHLYLASWGTRRLMVRIPKRLINRSRIEAFVRDVDEVKLLESGANLIVDIQFDSEASGYSYSDEAGDGWLESLAPLRYDVLAGDLRMFYLLWLTALEREQLRDEGKEPLPGIAPLFGPHEAFAEFFQIDLDLVRAAAEPRGSANGGNSLAEASRRVIDSIPEKEKAALLLRFVDGDPRVGAEVRSKIRVASHIAQVQGQVERRTVAEIRRRTLTVRAKREAAEARRREAERLRKVQEAERARRARLDSVKLRGAQVWDDIERDIERKNARCYDRAANLLADLQALAEETGTLHAFSKRVESIWQRHRTKLRFLDRLRERRIGVNSR